MATRAPDETDILCENCGYMLNGLPPSGNCPECGTPIDLSISDQLRTPPLWENSVDPRPRWLRFVTTTAQIIFHPTRFYRSFKSRGELPPAFAFARIHWMIASLMFGTTAWLHWDTIIVTHVPHIFSAIVWVLACIVTYPIIWLTIRLAAWLTTLEATYRGYRLPIRVVRRAMYYNAAQLIPVGVVMLATVGGYAFWQTTNSFNPITYLYVLAGEVIVAAGYLFSAYWIAMSNLMYANR
jgi:hypothetical protein